MRKTILLLGVLTCLFCGCTALMPTTVNLNSPINDYQYVYITPTSEKNSVTGATLGGSYGVYGATTTHTANPMDIISGHFIKKGYIRVPEVKPENADKTIIVNYGEVKGGYMIDLSRGITIVIQMISASNNDLLCVCNAEGKGGTDAEAVTDAIDRCMDEFFRQINQ